MNALLNRTDTSEADQPGEALVWSMALKAEPTLSDCTSGKYGSAARDKVVCHLTFGEDFFYSKVLGETHATEIVAYLLDDSVEVTDFETPVGATPNGVLIAEIEFQTWVRQNRPELADQLRFVSLSWLENLPPGSTPPCRCSPAIMRRANSAWNSSTISWPRGSGGHRT